MGDPGAGGPPAAEGPPAVGASAARFRAALRCATLRRERRPDFNLFDRWSWLAPRAVATVVSSLAAVGIARVEPPAPPAPPDECLLVTDSFPDPATRDPVVVIVSKSRILVGEDPEPVLLLPSREALVASDADARYKRGGPDDMLLVPLERALTRTRDAIQARCRRRCDDGPVEAVVVADGSTPYRLLVEVLYTLGQSGLGKYHLMVRSGKKPK